jgi:hypothetical protein
MTVHGIISAYNTITVHGIISSICNNIVVNIIISEKEDHNVAMQMSFKTKKPNGDIKTGITITQVKPWLRGVGWDGGALPAD